MDAIRMRFFTGLHQPSDAKHFDSAFISVNRLRNRKGPFAVGGSWILDSGAFTEISTHGYWRTPVSEYAAQIRRWKHNGHLLAAVSQDMMAEPWILKKTNMTVEQHQQITIDRYDELVAEDTGVYIMPVLQGFACEEYLRHLAAYGDRFAHGAWVGVGSVCKRNGDVRAIQAILSAIKLARPDLRLHGFGLKTTALADPWIRSMLHTADSMAWSYSARIAGRNGNDWREAMKWTKNITSRPVQWVLDLYGVATKGAVA